MSETSPLVYYSRSHVTTDWSCRRKRYWQYEYNGRGIVSSHIQKQLEEGTAIHQALAEIALGHQEGTVNIDKIADDARCYTYKQIYDSMVGEAEDVAMDFAAEQAALVEGIVRGFYRYQWPILMSQYPTIILVEQEVLFKHGGVCLMAKPDLVVEDKEGNLWYLEYKSTSSRKPTWTNSWATAIQLHATAKAIEEHLGRPVTGVIVQGLYKGYESYGKQSSPFCYGYQRGGNPPFIQPEIRYEYASGFRRTATWNLPGGVRQWVATMPEEILANQFMQSAPIFINEAVLWRFIKQVELREEAIREARNLLTTTDDPVMITEVLDEVFPQTFDQCSPAWGSYSCPYRMLCHGHVSDPLSQGFTYRVSHHDVEREQIDAANKGE